MLRLMTTLAALSLATAASAADLGGNCCADLEERVAELEATTARKGNRKVSLTVTGQVNKAIMHYDLGDDLKDQKVIENSASESFVGVQGKAVIRPGWEAGFVLQIGQGRTGLDVDFLAVEPGLGSNNDLYTRQSFVFVSTPGGVVSVGRLAMATDDLVSDSVASTGASTKRLTLQPIGNIMVGLGDVNLLNIEIEPFNGQKSDALRYDTPTMFGVLRASAAWSSDTDSWDAALRYSQEVQGIQLLAGIGYEVDKGDDLLTFILASGEETRTTTLNAGLKHLVSGIFAQGSWAKIDVEDGDSAEAYHVQAGVERKWLEVGATTLFAEYSDWADFDFEFYGVGINQAVADGAVDLYLLGRKYEFGDEDGTSVLGGVRVKF